MRADIVSAGRRAPPDGEGVAVPRLGTTRCSPRPTAAAAAGWSVEAACTHAARGRGLLGRPGLPERAGLWLPTRSVHTVGMRFALDLVWLGRAGEVVRVDEGVRPGRVRTCLIARGGVVEVAAGGGAAFVAAIGGGPARAEGRARPGQDD